VSVFYQIIFYSAISQQIILIENKDNFKYLDGLKFLREKEKKCALYKKY
jgi:hypothetical protein